MSSVNNIRVDPNITQTKPLSDEQVNQRIELFSGDTVEVSPSTQSNPELVALPVQDPAAQATVSGLMADATHEGKKNLIEIGNQLFHGITNASGANADKAVEQGLRGVIDETGTQNANEAVNSVIGLTVQSANVDLQEFTIDLQNNLKAKGEKREEISMLRDDLLDMKDFYNDQLRNWPDGDEQRSFTFYDKDGKGETVPMSKADAQAKADSDISTAENNLEDAENELATLGDMTSAMQIKLEGALNKQQEAIQLLSNIMAKANKTAEAIISNMK